MINENKVMLMTKASLYEGKSGKKKLRIMKYFRHDYISLQLLSGWFFGTLSFMLCAALWGAYNMEYLLENINKMDLKSLGMTVLWLYVGVMAAYLSVLYVVSSYRYYTAKKSVGSYMHTLQKISDIYASEEKGTGSGGRTEDV